MNNRKRSRRKFSRSSSNQSSRKPSEGEIIPVKTKTLHSKEISSSIINDNVYNKEGIKLKNLEGGKEPLYLGQIDFDDSKYIGVLNTNLKRSGAGINFFENGDKCLGFYENDLVTKNGFYYYNPVIEEGKTKSQFYWGQFKNGCKDGKGISLWLNENEGALFNNFDDASFDAFVGKVEIYKMIKGLYFSKKEDKFYVYYGEFDSKQRKRGDNCFYYNPQKDTLIYGKMEKDNFTNGYLGIFDDNGNIKDFYQCEFGENNTVSKYVTENEINNSDELKKKMTNIRNILLEKDIFGDIFNSFKEAAEFVDDIDISEKFEDENYYSKILIKITGYNTINILKAVEDII